MPLDWDALATAHAGLASIPSGLRANAGRVVFAGGTTIARRGTRPRHMLFVLAGELRLVRHSAAGDKVILQRGRHGFIAEASMDAAAYHCDIEAVVAGQLLAFPIARFHQALDDDATFRRAWNQRLAVEIRHLRAQNERLHLPKAADRVRHYLEAEGHDGVITLTQTRKAWAEELGLSHEALYRTLRQMANAGVIRVSGSQIERL